MKRRGFTLVEVIVWMPVAIALAAVVLPFFVCLIRDVPRCQELVEVHAMVSSALQQLGRDVDAAEAMPASACGVRADDRTLLLRLPGRVVRYRLDGADLTRDELPAPADGRPLSTHWWPVPKARITFHRWQRPGGPDDAYAVEVRTAVEYHHPGYVEPKLANTFVYFLDGIGARRQSP